jgi:Zn finger protein HypA/HybF involved in hydrogenase expression
MKQDLWLNGADVIAVGEASLLLAQQRVSRCEVCSDSASLRFDALLRQVIGSGKATEYFLGFSTKCPTCDSPIFENTLVDSDEKGTAAFGQLKYLDSRDQGQEVVFVDEATLIEAEDFIFRCEYCSAEAEMLLSSVGCLDRLRSHDHRVRHMSPC